MREIKLRNKVVIAVIVRDKAGIEGNKFGIVRNKLQIARNKVESQNCEK